MKFKISKTNKIRLTMLSTTVVLIVIFQLFTGWMYRKNYDSYKDFSCCKNNKLVIHHYYDYSIVGFVAFHGYDDEPITQKDGSVCAVPCSNDQ